MLKIKNTQVAAFVVTPETADGRQLRAELDRRRSVASDHFNDAPAVLDFSLLAQASAVDATAIIETLRSVGFRPIGFRSANSEVEIACRRALLVEMPALDAASASTGSRTAITAKVKREAVPRGQEVVAPKPAPPPVAVGQPDANTKVVGHSLRSGQQSYAKGGDLVVIGMVSHGAEAIADGCVHVYGPLRGKAVAGAGGDRNANIFTTCMEAELVSIAGVTHT